MYAYLYTAHSHAYISLTYLQRLSHLLPDSQIGSEKKQCQLPSSWELATDGNCETMLKDG